MSAKKSSVLAPEFPSHGRVPDEDNNGNFNSLFNTTNTDRPSETPAGSSDIVKDSESIPLSSNIVADKRTTIESDKNTAIATSQNTAGAPVVVCGSLAQPSQPDGPQPSPYMGNLTAIETLEFDDNHTVEGGSSPNAGSLPPTSPFPTYDTETVSGQSSPSPAHVRRVSSLSPSRPVAADLFDGSGTKSMLIAHSIFSETDIH